MALENKKLGVIQEGDNTRFSVYSANAEKVELCLFSDDEAKEHRIELHKDEDNVWSVLMSGINEGQKYGYRAHGQFNPSEGLVFNSNKLLIDPYATELSKSFDDWENEALYNDNDTDSAYLVPKSVVSFDNIQEDAIKYPYLHKAPQFDEGQISIYETHVKGFSQLHPDIPEDSRGLFKAMSQPQVINYLKAFNFTHLELLPVTTTLGGRQLKKELGLSDYWGYNPVNHFAFDKRYGTKEEFKEMVSKLHEAGIEVVLDVVYNHTGEFSLVSNSVSYKGLDGPSYYRYHEDNKGEYVNTTGCGNSFNINSEPARRILEDSMEYFIENCGVGGFRFDLAGDCALGPDHRTIDQNGAFLTTIREMKEKHGVQVFGEEWSAVGGYFRGELNGITGWDDKHEHAVRKMFNTNEGNIGDIAAHMSGGDSFSNGEKKSKFINYITAHDGFTLRDLVIYPHKNNWANNEHNRDGSDQNYSAAAPSEEIGYRRMKSMLAANYLARGIPLISGGDEWARSQNGNNNAYCQDNDLTWHKWKTFNKHQQDLYMFVRKLTAFRASHPLIASVDTFSGKVVEENGRKDIEWLRPDGQEMHDGDWHNKPDKTLAYVVNGLGAKVSPDEASRHKEDDDFLVIMSGNSEHAVSYKLPTPPNGKRWQRIFDTSDNRKLDLAFEPGGNYDIQPHAVAVFVCKREISDVKENNINRFIDRARASRGVG